MRLNNMLFTFIMCVFTIFNISFVYHNQTKVLAEIKTTPIVIEIRDFENAMKPEEKLEKRYYDVPLEKDLQDYIFALCEEYGIYPELAIGMIETESNFNASAVGDGGNSLGLMQIQPRWHQDRMNKLGCTNLLDPYQNVKVGIDYLAELMHKDKSVEWALMAYNGGHKYADEKLEERVLSEYAETVLTNSRELQSVL